MKLIGKEINYYLFRGRIHSIFRHAWPQLDAPSPTTEVKKDSYWWIQEWVGTDRWLSILCE